MYVYIFLWQMGETNVKITGLLCLVSSIMIAIAR